MAVSSFEKIFFIQNLSMMLKSGIPIVEALEILKKEAKSRSLKKILENVKRDVLEGKSLSQGFGRYPKIFDNFFCSVIEMGEKTGSLEENLDFLFSKLEREEDLKSKIRGAMVYPSIILFFAIIIILLIFLYLLPKITPLFRLMGFELPLATRILISMPNFFKQNWPKFLIFIFSVFILVKVLRKIGPTRYFLDRISLSLPFFGQFFKNLNLSTLSYSLYVLLKSGLPLREGLEICANTLPNQVYKNCLISTKSYIERGERIGKSFRNFPKFFPYVFSQMILVGERSGRLEETFFYQSKFYEEKVVSSLKSIIRIVEPSLIIFVGGIVAFLAISIISTIYRFISQFAPR